MIISIIALAVSLAAFSIVLVSALLRRSSYLITAEYSDGATPLRKAHITDASFDLCVDRDVEVVLGRQGFTTGIKLGLPFGIHAFVMPTSGNSLKGMNARIRKDDGTIENYRLSGHVKIGTVDSGYRGEIKVVFDCYENPNGKVFIEKGTKVAQLFVVKGLDVAFEEGTVSVDTDRMDGGFGMTDILHNPINETV